MYLMNKWMFFCYFKFYICILGRYDVFLFNVECLDCEKDIFFKIEDLIS